jgi:predicted aspartyl protease
MINVYIQLMNVLTRKKKDPLSSSLLGMTYLSLLSKVLEYNPELEHII